MEKIQDMIAPAVTNTCPKKPATRGSSAACVACQRANCDGCSDLNCGACDKAVGCGFNALAKFARKNFYAIVGMFGSGDGGK